MQSPRSPLSNYTKHIRVSKPNISTQNQNRDSILTHNCLRLLDQQQAPLTQQAPRQHHPQTSTSSLRRHTIDASILSLPKLSKTILLFTERRSKWHFASLTNLPSQKHHLITHWHPLRYRATITRDMMMWNWKDAVMFRTQAPVVEDVDPLVIVNSNSRGDVSFVDEKWTPYGKEKDRPGWRVSEQALDTESILDSDSEDYHSSDDDMTVAGSDFSDDGSKEPYIIIHSNEDSNLHQKFAAIDLSPGRLKYRDRHEIHQLEDKISRWSTLLNDERQLIQGIAEWLESLIPYNIWDVSSCGQPSRVPSICSATPSSCPLCLIRCLKPYPEWSFLFPILEESANRLATGAYAMKDLNDNLIALGPEEFWWGEDSFSSEFNNEIPPARHPCNIPEPPPPQRLTRKIETQISEAELGVSNMNAGVIAMNQSTILPG